MPIRINLLAEAQAAEEMRRNDPVKRAMWVGGFLLAIVALWAFKVQMDISLAKSRYANTEAGWKSKEALYASVTNNQARTWEIERKLAQLDRLTTNRFLWGPVLNALQKTAIDDVPITHIHGEQSYTREDAHDIGKIHYPAGVAEHIKLSIDARDNNPNEQGYNKFKEALNQSDYFVKHVGRKDSFVIEGVLSPVTADPLDPTRQFLTFTLASRFPETRFNE
ncbi:MAG TPA: hypothetical protein VHB20_04455 [Verrucomicrobiae bacterium]|jgi:hypothetical protein|nr:hypothetical protein [Verrucomicrobiae bacterium]